MTLVADARTRSSTSSRFQLLTLDLAEARGIDPDPIRRDDPRWKAARDAYA